MLTMNSNSNAIRNEGSRDDAATRPHLPLPHLTLLEVGADESRAARAKANAEKAKAEAVRQVELEAAQARIEAELAAAHDASVYKVKGPRSVKAAGGTIPRSVRNRTKAREEAERAAEKQRAQNAKGKKSKK